MTAATRRIANASGRSERDDGRRTAMTARLTARLCAVIAAALLWPATAQVEAQQPAAPPAAVDVEGAQREFDRGIDALKGGRFQQAIEALEEAYRLGATSLALYNLGLAHQSLDNAPRAVETWESYLEAANPDLEQQTIDAVRREIQRITATFARFELSVEPDSAQITIDGEIAVPVANELWVQPGSRRILITAQGFDPFEQSLVVQSGRFSLDIKLRRPQGTPTQVAAGLLIEGEGLIAAGNRTDGVKRLEKSYALHRTAHTAGALGLAQEEMGRLGRAEQLVEAALEERSDPWVKKHKRELRLARRRLTGKGASLYIVGENAGAEITVNGRVVGKLPLPEMGKIRVGEGPVTIKARQGGYDPYSVDLQVKARTEVRVNVLMYRKKPVPVVTILVPIAAWPKPVAAAPPPEPVALEPELEPEKAKKWQPPVSDVEYEGEPPPESELVKGLEVNIDFGYLFWVNNNLSDSHGGIASRLFSIGYRPHWIVSFGVQIIGGQIDLWTEDTDVVSSAIVAGLYARLHSQPERREMVVDVWGGTGIQPVSMNITAYKAEDLTPADITENTQVQSGIKNELGVGDTVTLQTINVPLDLGLTWYITEKFGLTANLQYTFWFPTQQCFHDSSDKICYEDNLKTMTSFYMGLGFAILP